MTSNRQEEQVQFVFSEIPEEYPVPGKHLSIEKHPINLETISLSDGQILVKTLFISLDPYMRGQMRDPNIKSYSPPFKLGKPLFGGGIAQVIRSKNSDFPVGSIVTSMYSITFEKYSVIQNPAGMGLRVIENALRDLDKIPLSYYLGILGMPGLTAYCGLKKYGNPQPGETLFVSAASGAVGQVVGQIAKIYGLKVIGIAGSDEKVKYLKKLEFDSVYNYKTVNLDEVLGQEYPDGVNINFENVGGEVFDILLNHMAQYGRILLCGYISEYNKKERYGVKNLMNVLLKRLEIHGFIIYDFYKEYEDEFNRVMREWILEGKIHYTEDISEGLETAPAKLIGLYKGENFGKVVIKVSEVEHI